MPQTDQLFKMIMMTVSSKRRKWLRRLGLIIGFFIAVLWLSFGIVLSIGDGMDIIEALFHTAVPGLVFLASIIIAFRWAFAGGVFLIVEGLVVSFAYSAIFGHCQKITIVFVILLMSLPLLVSGILLILSCREGRKPPQAESGCL